MALLYLLLGLLVFLKLRSWIAVASKASDASTAPRQRITHQEANAILGVNENASADEIKAAYHALMQKLHPDHGGNHYLASQLNQAKEVLLKETERDSP